MSIRGLARDTLIYGTADLLPRVVNFALLPLTTHYLSPADYGILGLVQFISGIAEPMYVLGLDGAFMRFYPEAKTDEARGSAIRTIALRLFLQGILGAVIFAAVLPAAIPAALGRGVLAYWPFGVAALLMPLFYLPSAVPLGQARMEGRPKFYFAFRVGSFLLSISLILFFVVVKEQRAWGSIKGQLIAAAVSGGVLLWMYRNRYRAGPYDRDLVRRAKGYGFPLFLNQASSWLFNTTDKAFIQRFRTTQAVGHYQMGYNFVAPLDILINAVNFSWLPRLFREGRDPTQRELLLHDALRIVASIGAVLLVYLAGVRWLISFMTDERFHIAYRISEIMVFYFMTRILSCFATGALGLLDKNVWVTRNYFFTGVVNLILNLVMIPPGGAIGAAWATVLTGVLSTGWLLRDLSKLWTFGRAGRRGLLLLSGWTALAGGMAWLDFGSGSSETFASLCGKSVLVLVYVGIVHVIGFRFRWRGWLPIGR